MGSGSSTATSRRHCIKCSRDGRPVIFYMNPNSPASRMVWMLLKHLDVPFKMRQLDLQSSEHKTDPDFGKVNPTRTVPALQVDNFCIWDSRAIMMYIVESLTECGHHPAANMLYPKDGLIRAKIHHVMYFDATSFYQSLIDFMMPILVAGEEPDQTKLSKIDEMMSIFDETILGPPLVRGVPQFAAGQHLTVADFSLVTSVLCTEFISDNYCFKFPHIKDWLLSMKTKYMRVEFRECNKDFFDAVLKMRAQQKEEKMGAE